MKKRFGLGALFLFIAIIISACVPAPLETPSNDSVLTIPPIPAVIEQEADISVAEGIAGDVSDDAELPAEEPYTEPQDTEPESDDDSAIVAPPAVSPPAAAPAGDKKPGAPEAAFTVHFIDVGQADSALVLCGGASMLIDGGNAGDSNLIYAFLKNRGITRLDYIIATHAHEDHVGGLAGALNYATATTAFSPVTEYNTRAFESFVKYLEQQEISITVPKHGDSFKLGGADVKILGPIKPATAPNNTSIVIKIIFGATSFLFTGDAEREEEQNILDAGYDLSATVLKVGHHGSDTSTTYPFLREIMPRYAVISCGKGNSYGHPHDDVLSRLRDADVTLFRTDMQGTITCISDGKTVSFTTERNDGAHTNTTEQINPAQPEANTQTEPVQPADSAQADPAQPAINTQADSVQPLISEDYFIGNINSKKFHRSSCSHLPLEKNRVFFATREAAINAGYSPCGICKPQN